MKFYNYIKFSKINVSGTFFVEKNTIINYNEIKSKNNYMKERKLKMKKINKIIKVLVIFAIISCISILNSKVLATNAERRYIN